MPEGVLDENGRMVRFNNDLVIRYLAKRAIEEMDINYPQIMAEQSGVGADAYGVMGIPHIILFGPDGTILARDLRGEMIEMAVKQHLGL